MKNILLIGTGPWGQNYLKTLKHFCVQVDTAGRSNWESAIDKKPDGVIVCTPPNTHVPIASYALSKNIPVIIEKPLSLSIEECQKLKQYQIPILVNHIHLFSNAYQTIKRCVDPNKIKDIISLGYNKGPVRDYSSLLDYGCHDLSMILDISDQTPITTKIDCFETNNGSLFKISMDFDKFSTVSLVGNGGERRVRKFTIETEGITMCYSDIHQLPVEKSPLFNAIQVFLNAIDGVPDNRLGIDLSLKVLSILQHK